MFSDLYINKTSKIEILPTDTLLQETDVLDNGDRLLQVFRPISSNSTMNSVKGYFTKEFSWNYKISEDKNISGVLMNTIEAFGNSLVNPPADFTLDGEVEILIVYETPKKELYVAKVGSIQFKQRMEGKFKNVIEDGGPLSAKPDTTIMVGFLSK
jgi:hypothetical protein